MEDKKQQAALYENYVLAKDTTDAVKKAKRQYKKPEVLKCEKVSCYKVVVYGIPKTKKS